MAQGCPDQAGLRTGPLTGEHQPRIRAAWTWSARPSLTQSGPRRPFYSPLIFAALMIGRHLSISALCNAPSASGIDAYFTRLNATSPVPPVEPPGAANLKSSPVRVTTVRVCSVPVQFGYVLASILKLIVFVAGSYV
jgi:hypothetical protein